jgi:hypothetical protein
MKYLHSLFRKCRLPSTLYIQLRYAHTRAHTLDRTHIIYNRTHRSAVERYRFLCVHVQPSLVHTHTHTPIHAHTHPCERSHSLPHLLYVRSCLGADCAHDCAGDNCGENCNGIHCAKGCVGDRCAGNCLGDGCNHGCFESGTTVGNCACNDYDLDEENNCY